MLLKIEKSQTLLRYMTAQEAKEYGLIDEVLELGDKSKNKDK